MESTAQEGRNPKFADAQVADTNKVKELVYFCSILYKRGVGFSTVLFRLLASLCRYFVYRVQPLDFKSRPFFKRYDFYKMSTTRQE